MRPAELPKELQHLPELHRDDWLWIVNKPSGLLVHRGWGRERVTALSLGSSATGRYLYPVHRLDRATSGALVFAFDAETTRLMQGALQSARSSKVYLALVRGIAPERALIDHPLAKSKQHEKRPAVTAIERIGTFERYSLVRARPLTGRLHQIRRHLKFISHPLIGDTKYGKGEHNRIFRERFALNRLALHAVQLRLEHPVTKEPLLVRAPLPHDLLVPMRAMGLEAAALEAVFGSSFPEHTADWRVLSDSSAPGVARPPSGGQL